jgi:hypothetical protein
MTPMRTLQTLRGGTEVGRRRKGKGQHDRWKKTSTTGAVRRVFIGNVVEPRLALLVLHSIRLTPVETMTVAPGLAAAPVAIGNLCRCC